MASEMRVHANNVDLDLLMTIPSYEIKEPKVYERINGEYTFEFTLHDKALADTIHNNHIVFADADYFIIVRKEITHGEAFEARYMCEHISYLLNFHDADSDELDTEITYTGTVYSIIPQMLAGTNFAFRLSDDTPGGYTFKTKKRGIRARIIEFCTTLGFEVTFSRFSVYIQNRRGTDHGLIIEFGTNILKLRETRLLNFNRTEDIDFDLDFVDLNYVMDINGNPLAQDEMHLGDPVYVRIDDDLIQKRCVAAGYNPFEHALPTVELSDNVTARDLAQQMMKKGSGGGSGGLAINGTNEMLTVYKSNIQQGDLVTVRRTFDISVPFKLENPTVLPSDQGSGVAISRDGSYMAVVHNTTPFVTIYKRNNNIFTKLPNPSELPPNTAYSVAFSNDGNYLVVGHLSTPYITIYKRDGDEFIKILNPPSLPAGPGRGVVWSSDNDYLAVGHVNTPRLSIYKRDGEVFNKLPTPSAIPNNTGYGISFSNNGNYLAVAHSTTPFITIYKKDGEEFTKLPNPSTLPTGQGNGVSFSNDNRYLAVAHNTAPYLTIYSIDGDTFTKIQNPSVLPTGNANGVSFSNDSNYLAVAHASYPFVTFYKVDGETFTKIDNPAILPTGMGNGVDMSSTQPYIAVGHANSPFVTIYKTDIAGDYAYAYNGPTDIYRENFYSVAVAMEDGQTNDISKRVTTIPIA